MDQNQFEVPEDLSIGMGKGMKNAFQKMENRTVVRVHYFFPTPVAKFSLEFVCAVLTHMKHMVFRQVLYVMFNNGKF